MPLQVAKHYTSPTGMPLRWNGPLLSTDIWPAVSQANDVMSAARQQAAEIMRRTESEVAKMLSAAQTRAQLEANLAMVAAQREVWQGVLQAWLGFVGRLHEQRAEAKEFAVLALKTALSRLKLDASTEQQMLSSVSLLLEHNVRNATGELHVCPENAQSAHDVLNRLGHTDVLVVADAAISRSSCILRCGELSFETNFENNVKTMLDALERLACEVNA